MTTERERIDELKKWDVQHVWHPFTAMSEYAKEDPLLIERGEGFFLVDASGRRYIDGVSSLWVNVHGHGHAKINRAIREQLEKIAHSTMLGITNVPAVELAKRLVDITPEGLEKVFFSDNGSTAMESALKIAYQYHRQKPAPSERRVFVTLGNAYHGDTVGSVSLGGIDLFHNVYKDLLFETVRVPSPFPYRCPFNTDTPDACRAACLDALAKIMEERGSEVAAVVMEPLVQAAAGMIVHPEGFLSGVREITKNHGVLLILDEVATGFGRTGRMFASGHEGVRPDIMAVAKGLTGGYLPVAATLATDEIYEAFLGPREASRTFFHGHTYTGNPLGCAAALANLDTFEEERTIENMRPKIAYIAERLEELASHPHVGDVRQKGFMVGIEFVRDKATKEPFPASLAAGHRVTLEARKQGAVIRPLGDVVVLMPPPAIDMDTLEKLLDITVSAITISTNEHE